MKGLALLVAMYAATAAEAPDLSGFVQRWLLLEPIPANGLTDSAVQAAVKKDYFPNQFTAVPRNGEKANVNDTDLTWHVVDTKNYIVNHFHFARDHGKKTSDVLFWAGSFDRLARSHDDPT